MSYGLKQLAAALALALSAPLVHAAACTTPDQRPTVIAGSMDSGVPNRATGDGCTINDLIVGEDNWGSHGEFVRHVSRLTLHLFKRSIISGSERGRIVGAAAASDMGNTIKVKVIGFNDFHGNLKSTGNFSGVPAGGVDYLTAHIDALRAAHSNHVVVSAGDLIGASPLISALFHDEPTIEAMNRLGLDFNAVGNHEFDEGRDELLRMQNGGCHPTDANSCKGASVGTPVPFEGAAFNFLAANVVDRNSGNTLFPSYRIKNFKGNKVAFIGMTLKGTPSIVTPSGVAGLDFKDEADTVNALIPKLKRQGVEAVVVLIHEGGMTTGGINECPDASGAIVDIVRRLDDAVDVVVSGHTHRAYVCHLPNKAGHSVLTTSAGSFGRVITDINMNIDTRSKNVTGASAANLVVDRSSVTPNAALATLVANYEALSAPAANRVIGSVTATLTRSTNAAGESSLGDVIADAQFEATRGAGFGEAVAAFMNPGGIRADITYPQSGSEGDGNVTYGEAFTTQPFGNSLVTMTLNGAQIETLLEQQFAGCPNNQPFNRILQVSQGFEYTLNATGPACDKIDPTSIKIGGVMVDPMTNYRVTVNSFLADGGDNFTVLTQGTSRLGGAQDLDALEAYFHARSTVAPGPQNRIKRITQPLP